LHACADAWIYTLISIVGVFKSFLAVEALEAYIEQPLWRKAEVKAGIAEADKGAFATGADMSAIFAK
jgi:predicted transcriptional regulator